MLAPGILAEPGEVAELLRAAFEVVVAAASRAAGVLPLGLGRQTVAVGGEIAGPRGQVVARRQPLGGGPGVAELQRVGPTDPFHGVLLARSPRRVLPHQPLVEILRHLVAVHVEGADRHLVGRTGVALGLATHREAAAGNQHHLGAARRDDLGRQLGRWRFVRVRRAAGRGLPPLDAAARRRERHNKSQRRGFLVAWFVLPRIHQVWRRNALAECHQNRLAASIERSSGPPGASTRGLAWRTPGGEAGPARHASSRARIALGQVLAA